MKAIDPKDRPKLFALIAVAVIVFGFSGFQVVSYNTAQTQMIAGAQAATAKKAAATTASAATGAATAAASAQSAAAASTNALMTGATPAAGATVNPATTAGTVVAAAGAAAAVTPANLTSMSGVLAALGPAALMPPTGGKDPFVPVGRFAQNQAKVNAPPVPQSPPAMPLPLPSKSSVSFDASPIINETTGTLSGERQPDPKPLVFIPPSPPPYIVTGVVVADRDVPDSRSIAVLRGGNGGGNSAASGATGSPAAATATASGERRFVGVGDPVGNGFVVASVRADGVDLRNGKQLVTLKIGIPGNVK